MQRKVDDATAERAKTMEEMAPADGPSRLEGERAVEGLQRAKDRLEDRYQLLLFSSSTQKVMRRASLWA